MPTDLKDLTLQKFFARFSRETALFASRAQQRQQHASEQGFSTAEEQAAAGACASIDAAARAAAPRHAAVTVTRAAAVVGAAAAAVQQRALYGTRTGDYASHCCPNPKPLLLLHSCRCGGTGCCR